MSKLDYAILDLENRFLDINDSTVEKDLTITDEETFIDSIFLKYLNNKENTTKNKL